jgi:hypothetical protein
MGSLPPESVPSATELQHHYPSRQITLVHNVSFAALVNGPKGWLVVSQPPLLNLAHRQSTPPEDSKVFFRKKKNFFYPF